MDPVPSESAGPRVNATQDPAMQGEAGAGASPLAAQAAQPMNGVRPAPPIAADNPKLDSIAIFARDGGVRRDSNG